MLYKTEVSTVPYQFSSKLYFEECKRVVNSTYELFFFYLGFLSRPFTNHRTAGEGGGGISLTPHYHFHPLHRHLDIRRAITAESSPLHIASAGLEPEPLVSERKSLTIKLRTKL